MKDLAHLLNPPATSYPPPATLDSISTLDSFARGVFRPLGSYLLSPAAKRPSPPSAAEQPNKTCNNSSPVRLKICRAQKFALPSSQPRARLDLQHHSFEVKKMSKKASRDQRRVSSAQKVKKASSVNSPSNIPLSIRA